MITKTDVPSCSDDGPAPSNAFVRVLQVHAKGEVCNKMADALQEAVQAVALTGKPSTITLQLKVVPATRGAYAIEFLPVKLKLPAGEAARSLWFGDEEHRLHREDQKQKDLPLRTMPKAVTSQEPTPKEVAGN